MSKRRRGKITPKPRGRVKRKFDQWKARCKLFLPGLFSLTGKVECKRMRPPEPIWRTIGTLWRFAVYLDLDERVKPYRRELSQQDLLGLDHPNTEGVPSRVHAYLQNLPDDQRAALLAELRDLIERDQA